MWRQGAQQLERRSCTSGWLAREAASGKVGSRPAARWKANGQCCERQERSQWRVSLAFNKRETSYHALALCGATQLRTFGSRRVDGIVGSESRGPSLSLPPPWRLEPDLRVTLPLDRRREQPRPAWTHRNWVSPINSARISVRNRENLSCQVICLWEAGKIRNPLAFLEGFNVTVRRAEWWDRG